MTDKNRDDIYDPEPWIGTLRESKKICVFCIFFFFLSLATVAMLVSLFLSGMDLREEYQFIPKIVTSISLIAFMCVLIISYVALTVGVINVYIYIRDHEGNMWYEMSDHGKRILKRLYSRIVGFFF